MKFSSPSDVQFKASTGLIQWFKDNNLSIAAALPRQNQLITFGQKSEKLKIFNRVIPGCSAIHRSNDDLYVSSQNQIWKFINIHKNKDLDVDYDALYYPKQSWTTGCLDVHDIYAHDGITPLFVNTLFSCISTLDTEYNFKLIWRPEFISQLVPEDRCHISGMAIDPQQKIPRYITALGQTDSYEEWRLEYQTAGILLDVASGKIITENLSLPYSPRLHNNDLYCLEAGRGALIKIDPTTGKKTDICHVPGFARGLDFIDNYAIVGVSKPRRKKTFDGLELDRRLQKKKIDPECGFCVINLDNGSIEHSMYIDGPLEDVYDIKVLEGITSCSIIGITQDDINKIFYLDHEQ